MIKLELDINAVNFILSTLGELPTKTGAWELVDGKVVVNEAKKQDIIDAIQAPITAKASALAKLTALGLTQAEVTALIG